MAIKGLVWIQGVAPETDGTYKLAVKMWSGPNYAEQPNDTFFASTTASATVNAALKAFTKDYMTTNWEVEFGMLDDVKLINPVSLL